MTADQGPEECEVFEIDAEQSSAGTNVLFHQIPTQTPVTIKRPFYDVIRLLTEAGWKPIQVERDGAGNRVLLMRRSRQSGRAINDALDRLQS